MFAKNFNYDTSKTYVCQVDFKKKFINLIYFKMNSYTKI